MRVEFRFNGEEVRGSPWKIAYEEHERMEISRHEDRYIFYTNLGNAIRPEERKKQSRIFS